MGSRINNSAKNLAYAISVQIINIIIKFGVRTVFIYTLGKSYLGISGVFSNILTILSLADMGFGTAITYCMYAPIEKKEHKKLTQLVLFFRKIYVVVGIFIAVCGCMLIPFLDYIISDVPNIKYIKLIYLLHLANVVSTYFFAHYRSVLSAAQMERLNSKNQLGISIIKTIAEVLVLVITKNYILYLIVEIVVNLIGGYSISKVAKQQFPFITNKVSNLGKQETREIWKNSLHMLNIRIGQTLVNATDNILISTLINTVLVGIYSNYAMVIQIILTSTVLIENSLLGSIGNLCVNESYQKKTQVFKRVRYLYEFIYHIIAVSLCSLFSPFIILWVGEDYLLPNVTVLVIIFNAYLSGMRQPVEAFINAEGLFCYFKKKPMVEAVMNFVISIFLGKWFGITGVFLGTTISQLVTTFWYDPYIVYRYSLHRKFRKYLLAFSRNVIQVIIACCICCLIRNQMVRLNLMWFIILFMISVMVAVVTFWIFNLKREEHIYYVKLIYNIIKNKNARRNVG